MTRLNLIFAALVCMPLLAILFPMSHGGGPFPTTSFQVLALWGVALLIGSVIVLRKGSIALVGTPNLSLGLLVVAGVFVALIFLHDEQNDPVRWVAPGMVLIVSISLALFSNVQRILLDSISQLDRFKADLDAGLLLVGIVIALFHLAGIYEFFSESGLWTLFSQPVRFAGFFQQNLFATFVVSIVAFSIFNRFAGVNHSDVLWVSALSFLFAVVLSVQSKAGWLSLTVVLVLWVLVLIHQSKKKLLSEIGCVILFGTVFYSIYVFTTASETVGDGVAYSLSGADKGISIRLSALQASWFLGGESPWIGHGLGSFQKIYPDAVQKYPNLFVDYVYTGVLRHPHNELAYMWVSGGLFGILGVFILAAYLLFKQVDGWGQVPQLIYFLPIAVHSLVEFPLQQSSAHWYLLTIFLSWLLLFRREGAGGYLQVVRPISRSLISISAVVVALFVFALSVDGFLVGKERNANRLQLIEGVETVSQYLDVRADDQELRHWAYRQHDGLFHDRDIFQLAMKEGNGPLVAELLPNMKKVMRSLNNQESWSLYAGALAGLGKRAELIGFIDYIERLDPKYARGMRRAYGL